MLRTYSKDPSSLLVMFLFWPKEIVLFDEEYFCERPLKYRSCAASCGPFSGVFAHFKRQFYFDQKRNALLNNYSQAAGAGAPWPSLIIYNARARE